MKTIHFFKKSIFLFTVLLSMYSCEKHELNSLEPESQNDKVEEQNLIDFERVIDKKYDGQILTFEDEKDFTEFYSLLSAASPSQFDYFLSIKNGNNSSFYRDLFKVEEVIDNDDDVIKLESKEFNEIMVSEYLSTIFNYDNEIIIGNAIVLLDKSGNLVSLNEEKNSTTVIGRINNSSTLSTDRANNVNYTKSWRVYEKSSRRTTFYIFNETIIVSNRLLSSKVYYRKISQYESCSFWRCKWKSDNTDGSIRPTLTKYGNCNFSEISMNRTETTLNSTFTKLIANYSFVGACAPIPLTLTGSVTYTKNGSKPLVFSNISYSFNPH